jgi:hypothetical protein
MQVRRARNRPVHRGARRTARNIVLLVNIL